MGNFLFGLVFASDSPLSPPRAHSSICLRNTASRMSSSCCCLA
jgi:hypothetical protein